VAALTPPPGKKKPKPRSTAPPRMVFHASPRLAAMNWKTDRSQACGAGTRRRPAPDAGKRNTRDRRGALPQDDGLPAVPPAWVVPASIRLTRIPEVDSGGHQRRLRRRREPQEEDEEPLIRVPFYEGSPFRPRRNASGYRKGLSQLGGHLHQAASSSSPHSRFTTRACQGLFEICRSLARTDAPGRWTE